LHTTLVVGIDPGSIRTGYAFLEWRQSRLRVLEYGVIRLRAGETLPLRLAHIQKELSALLKTYEPTSMALETIFHGKFARSALILGHARGAIMATAAAHEVPILEYAPTLVKQAVVGKGHASKTQVAALIQSHLGLKQLPQPADAADALAIAFCHLMQVRSL
jgi:crossover junction endodeoxyribonuclease RuvC